eukprot:7149773-Pyramimonas_sp.AAC.1
MESIANLVSSYLQAQQRVTILVEEAPSERVPPELRAVGVPQQIEQKIKGTPINDVSLIRGVPTGQRCTDHQHQHTADHNPPILVSARDIKPHHRTSERPRCPPRLMT